MTVTDIAIVGLGKIARDKHVPSIAASDAFRLAATVSRNASASGIPAYRDLDTMLSAEPGIRAVALCVPPQVRFALARQAIEAGLDVLLEKPPGVGVAEVGALKEMAERAGRVLFATWHSRHAGGIVPARAWLAGRTITGAHVTWREDVRHWHPGQDWIWEAGGLGVFDPGINALSILTAILPVPVLVRGAVLEVPSNRQTPIAARLDMATAEGAPIDAVFDWREAGRQVWEIEITTDRGTLYLSEGGGRFFAEGSMLAENEALHSEYDGIYARFAELLSKGKCDVDIAPLQLVADAFMIGHRTETEPFHD